MGINAPNRNPPPYIKTYFFDLLTVFLSPSTLKSCKFFFKFFFLCFVQGRVPFRILKATSDRELISFAFEFLMRCK